MTPEHDEVRFLLGAFVLGGLDVDDRNAVEAHLAGCAGCRAELDETASVPTLLRRLPGTAGAGEPSLDELLQRVRADDGRFAEPAPGASRRSLLCSSCAPESVSS